MNKKIVFTAGIVHKLLGVREAQQAPAALMNKNADDHKCESQTSHDWECLGGRAGWEILCSSPLAAASLLRLCPQLILHVMKTWTRRTWPGTFFLAPPSDCLSLPV